MLKLILLLFSCMLSLPAFGQDAKGSVISISIYNNENHYLQLRSPDGKQAYAAVKYPSTAVRFLIINPPHDWSDTNFGWKTSGTWDMFFGQVKQNLQPTLSPLDKKSEREFETGMKGRFSFGINLDYTFDKGTDHPLRLFYGLGVKLTLPVFNLGYDPMIAVTNDPNRSAACATAVNNSLADPTLSAEAINAACPILTVDELLFFRVKQQFGVDWIPIKHLKLSLSIESPFDLQRKGYTLHEEPRLIFGIGYNHKI